MSVPRGFPASKLLPATWAGSLLDDAVALAILGMDPARAIRLRLGPSAEVWPEVILAAHVLAAAAGGRR